MDIRVISLPLEDRGRRKAPPRVLVLLRYFECPASLKVIARPRLFL